MHDTLTHRHGRYSHSHGSSGPHRHIWLPLLAAPAHDEHDHGHSHGLIDDPIKRSREGVRAVSLSLAVLGLATVLQAVIFAASGSVALLADLIHNGGDAPAALPLGIAFMLRSERAEGYAGLAVVAAIFISATVAVVEAINRLSSSPDRWCRDGPAKPFTPVRFRSSP
jgi:Co/Zn/Cd efflux system component